MSWTSNWQTYARRYSPSNKLEKKSKMAHLSYERHKQLLSVLKSLLNLENHPTINKSYNLQGQQLSTSTNNCTKQRHVCWTSKNVPVKVLPTHFFVFLFITARPSAYQSYKYDDNSFSFWCFHVHRLLVVPLGKMSMIWGLLSQIILKTLHHTHSKKGHQQNRNNNWINYREPVKLMVHWFCRSPRVSCHSILE